MSFFCKKMDRKVPSYDQARKKRDDRMLSQSIANILSHAVDHVCNIGVRDTNAVETSRCYKYYLEHIVIT